MTTRFLSMVLAVVLVTVNAPLPALSAPKSEGKEAKKAELTAQVKASVGQLGTGPDARIRIRRRDGSRLEGYVTQVNELGFTVADAAGVATQVPYGDVTKVRGHNLATGWKIAIGAGAIFAILFVLVWTGALGDAER